MIKATDKLISEFPKLLSKPYWFKMNCFLDIATHKDVLILQYGDCKINPIVRIHSESIVDRFPILDRENRNKYKKSIQKIISHGSGLIIHFYDDGRGSGFGGSIINKKYGRNITGIRHDSRDYRGISHRASVFKTEYHKNMQYCCFKIRHRCSRAGLVSGRLATHSLAQY